MTTGDHDPLGLRSATDAATTALFGGRLHLARAYVDLLAGDGVEHGLIGPRELPRLWDRHLTNSAMVADLLPRGVRVVDVGSGAGLPGLPLAIRRPDLRVDLVEPMLRRTNFLNRAVTELGLSESVRVFRGRADEPGILQDAGNADWVVARAVAPLDRLVRWCLPLLQPGGTLLAMKGSNAAAELAEHAATLAGLGAAAARVVEVGGTGLEPTWVVVIERSSTRVRRATRGSQ